MKKWWVLIGLVALALIAGGWWFWSLASVPAETAPRITLKVERSPVLVREPGKTLWLEATGGMTLAAGWSVKTGDGGQAALVFFRQAESRLDQNSEVTLGDAERDANDPTKLRVRLDLEFGRVWSRVLRLFDLDSRFSVKTSSVVATVRGTAFAVRANADHTADVWVSESAVTVVPSALGDEAAFAPPYAGAAADRSADSASKTAPASAATSSLALAEGYTADYDARGRLTRRVEISRDERAGRWFMTNTLADMAFVRAERDERRVELREMGGPRPDSLFEGLAQISERLHLSLANEQARDSLAERYLARRLGRLIELAETGKAGLAAQEFARLENAVKTKLRGPAPLAGRSERQRIKAALARVSLLVEDAAPSSALYPLKQRIEDLASVLNEDDRSAQFFARLLAVDARLGEASRLLDDNALEEAKTALDAAKDGIENVDRDFRSAAPGTPAYAGAGPDKQRDAALLGKLFALRAREDGERMRLRAALQAPAVEAPVATSTESLAPASTPIPTSTLPTVQPPVSAPPPSTIQPPPGPQPIAAPVYAGITAYIQPNPINVGQTAKLTVFAKRSSGAQDDVTARTKFSLVRGQGSLNGPLFTATVAGTIIIQADYADNGTTHSSQVSLTVIGLAVLQSLVVTASPSSLVSNQTASLTVSAKYSNGYVKNVTTLAKFQNLSSTLGTLSGTLFTAAVKGSGTAEIQAAYTEDGVTQSGSVFIPVTETLPYNPTAGY